MTREQFSHLADAAVEEAANHPRRYLWRLVGLALLGFGVVLGSLLLCIGVLVGAGWGVVWVHRQGRLSAGFDARILYLLLPVLWLTYALARSLWVRWPAPTGVRLRRGEAPRLFEQIDEIVRAGQAPRPHHVLLDTIMSAGVTEQPRLGLLGWPRRFLIIGLPLLATLSAEEFRAVLAHEFAHLRGRHGRLANWIYRLRATWAQLLVRLQARPVAGTGLLVAFVAWFAPRFDARSFALARQQEFESDRWAAELAGARNAASALLKLHLAGPQLDDEFWATLGDRAQREALPPERVMPALLGCLRVAIPSASQRRNLLRALALETEGDDTHPSLSERLTALGFRTEIVPASHPTAAEPLLPAELGAALAPAEAAAGPSALEMIFPAATLAELVEKLDAQWRKDALPGWKATHERAREIRARLAELDNQAAAATRGDGSNALSVAGEWETVALRSNLEESTPAGRQRTRVRLEEFLRRHPDHTPASFALGRMELAENDAAGIARLDAVVRADDEAAAAGEFLIYNFLRQQGRFAEAAQRRWNMRRRADALDLANRERSTLTSRDALVAHDLDPAAVAALRAAVAARSDVEQLYVARKHVKHLPHVAFTSSAACGRSAGGSRARRTKIGKQPSSCSASWRCRPSTPS